ncbi:RDD family protein [Synechocystis salina]|uniref:RDD family protein n=1 Tax=Synechocystis salina TaxID=945780 RepID=UPI001D15DF3D|nr:RDD family protein [Synechocystis salina]
MSAFILRRSGKILKLVSGTALPDQSAIKPPLLHFLPSFPFKLETMALFNHYQVETPESVELEFTLAGIGNRLYAVLIDYICLGTIVFVLLIIWAVLAYNLSLYVSDDWQLWLTAIQIFLIFAVYVGYFVFFETLWQGQTPGKRRAKIRVIRGDGRPVGLQEASLRALFRPIDDFLYIGALMIIFGRQEKRIGDLLADTLVIRESRDQRGDRLQLQQPEAAKALAAQLSQLSGLERITADHWLVIRDYLLRRGDLLPKARQQAEARLAQQIQDRLRLTAPLADTPPEVLLEAVYLACQDRQTALTQESFEF